MNAPEFKPSVEYPHITPAMADMDAAYRTGGILGLARNLYQSAINDIYNSEEVVAQKSTIKLAQDEMQEKYIIPELLSYMSEDIILALIRNDFAYKYVTDAKFRAQCMTVGNFPCCYVTAIVLTNPDGVFLSSTQLDKFLKKMNAYIDSAVSGTDYNTACRAIDRVYHSLNYTDRHNWCMYNPLLITFSKMLRKRKDVYPISTTFTRQTPLHIGYTDNAQRRLEEYSLDTTNLVSRTNKCYALTASICTVLGYGVKSVRVPILPLFSEAHRRVGEILLNKMSGSMVHDGGFDLMPPGPTQKQLTQEQYNDAKIKALLDQGYIEKGIKRLGKNIDEHTLYTQTLLDFRNSGLDNELNVLEEGDKELQKLEVVVEEEYKKVKEELQAELDKLKSGTQVLEKEGEILDFEEKFMNALKEAIETGGMNTVTDK